MRRVHAGPLEALAHRLVPRQTHTEVREGRDKDATRGKGGRPASNAGGPSASLGRATSAPGGGGGNCCIESKSRAGGTAVDCRPLVRSPDALMGLAICASIAQVPVQSGTGGGGTVGSLVECVSKGARAPQEEGGHLDEGVALPAGWLVLSGVSLRAWEHREFQFAAHPPPSGAFQECLSSMKKQI